MSIRSVLIATAVCILPAWAQAHEFWIGAEDYSVASGQPVTARFHVGEDFSGSSFSYIPNRTARFDMIVGDTVVPVPARIGDNPAFSVPDVPEGLLTIVHETTDSTLTYREWAKFEKFAHHKAFTDVLRAHAERGLPREGFREDYRRFAKALIAVGDGIGEDRAVGLRTEIVAQANPYTDDMAGGMPVQVLLEGAPKPGAQIEVFEKYPDDSVKVTLHTADDQGRTVIPMKAGCEYLLDSVAMVPIEPEEDGDAVWLSLWASLTFAVPQG